MFRRARIELKSPEQIRQMRRAGLVVTQALTAVLAEVRPGVATKDLDAVAADVIRSAGAQPSFLDYGAVDGQGGFSGVICASVNDEVVHGVPGDRVLADGDLISLDCGAIVDGWHGDSAVTTTVGTAPPAAAALSETTRTALWRGLAAARLGGRVSDIGAAVEEFVRSCEGPYAIVPDYVGHGIGSAMHQPPDVPNYGRPGRGPEILEGLVLAVEPMLTLGPPETRVLDDDWTVVTTDGSLAAHWEHTMTVTDRGVWVLTAPDGGEEALAALGVPYGGLD